jgi:hypothetical protein
MKRGGSLIILMVFICAATQAIMPASGWLWPIFGMGPPVVGCPNVCGGSGLPPPLDAMTPGTYQWGYPPVGRAELVVPGCAYGLNAFHGSINLGLTPPFGSTKVNYDDLPTIVPAQSKPVDNTTATIAGNVGTDRPSGLAGWLSSS